MHNILLDQEIQILRFWWKWEKCGNQNFTEGEKYIFYIQKQNTRELTEMKMVQNWNKYLHK